MTLLDLPGTLSGEDAHTARAREGLRSAAALVIVTTSELPGEAETAAIRAALDADSFVGRSLVVVNKINAENSDPALILDEVRLRLGPFADRVPVVATDALDHIEAVNDPDLDAEQREWLLARSGFDAFTVELQKIVDAGVEAFRPMAQAHELVRVLDDAV
ncbi:MAG: hypothetical protein QM621_02745 [Aeromicrobium sp.]|uniref:hypothetical protein n=1 Tax=Aeromicrobium sp. TaxID=1871063 RepID=UPI0039E3FCFA